MESGPTSRSSKRSTRSPASSPRAPTWSLRRTSVRTVPLASTASSWTAWRTDRRPSTASSARSVGSFGRRGWRASRGSWSPSGPPKPSPPRSGHFGDRLARSGSRSRPRRARLRATPEPCATRPPGSRSRAASCFGPTARSTGSPLSSKATCCCSGHCSSSTTLRTSSRIARFGAAPSPICCAFLHTPCSLPRGS